MPGTRRVPLSICSQCGLKLDAATNARGKKKPRPGDASVCLYCGHLMIFNDEMRLRELTGKEMYQIAGNKLLVMVQKARAEFVERPDVKSNLARRRAAKHDHDADGGKGRNKPDA